jgi:MarR family transcriptional regulator, lower aerobic nicotinate degradation pathway regulator
MTKKASFSNLQTHLGYWLRVVSNAISHSFSRKLKAEEITVAEWVLLRVLYDIEPALPSHLAKQMNMTKGAISKLADRLIVKNLLIKEQASHDKRAHLLFLTVEAQELVPRLASIADENDVSFFKVLSVKEQNQLDVILKKMAHECSLKDSPLD